tara:strand:+ start:38 stop:514 length:477 start_codon:yes stop_codon:yes gene_type:complete
MKNFVMTAMAVVLLSTTANANTISIRCNEEVQRGTLKLTNPPTMNCEDFELVQKYIGSGVSVGPNSKINELVSEIEKIQPAPKAQPLTEVTETPFEDGGMEIRRNELDDFTHKNFPGQSRNGNREWFSEKKSSQCEGWVNLNDILSGKCGSVQVNMTR